MNSFKVTYQDRTSYTTSANGTLKEFTDYLMQDGGDVVDENPVTGKETRRQIVSRGYALKIDKTEAVLPTGLHRDFGGYGILAPEEF